MIQSWSQFLSFATYVWHVRAQTDVSALIDAAGWTSALRCLLVWGVNTVVGSGNYELSLRSVYQLHIRQGKYLKRCSTLGSSPACHPLWHMLVNSNFSISALMNQPFQKWTQGTSIQTKLIVSHRDRECSFLFPNLFPISWNCIT